MKYTNGINPAKPSTIVVIIIVVSISAVLITIGGSYFVGIAEEESVIMSVYADHVSIEFSPLASIMAFSGPMAIPSENITEVNLGKPQPPAKETRSPGGHIKDVIKTGTYHSERGKEYWFTKTGENEIITIELQNEEFDRLVIESRHGAEWKEAIEQVISR